MGQLLANGVIAGTSQLNNHWAYSAPFAIQWLWPIIILIGIPFAPESPWWLIRKNRLEEAEKSLNRLSSSTVDNKLVLAMMIETDALEYEMETGTTYWDVFNKVNIRRTEIAVAVYTTQVFSGIYLVGYAAYFFSRKLSCVYCVDDAYEISRRSPYGKSIRHVCWVSRSRFRGYLGVLDIDISLRPPTNLQHRPRCPYNHYVRDRNFGLCPKLYKSSFSYLGSVDTLGTSGFHVNVPLNIEESCD